MPCGCQVGGSREGGTRANCVRCCISSLPDALTARCTPSMPSTPTAPPTDASFVVASASSYGVFCGIFFQTIVLSPAILKHLPCVIFFRFLCSVLVTARLTLYAVTGVSRMALHSFMCKTKLS